MLSPRCVKVFLDTDPGYNQIVFQEKFPWSENVENWCRNVEAHDQHFTYAENIHGFDCSVPLLGFDWKTTRMPILMNLWHPPAPGDGAGNQHHWTTVMSWNAFKGKLIYKGVEYKSKGEEFEKLISLPKRVKVPFLIAVGGLSTPWKWFEQHNWQSASRILSKITRWQKFRRLTKNGWGAEDGPSLSLTPQQYHQLISNSRAEFSVAKNVYVALRTGWFSCRSACYLAAGKPVVVQDTGFGSVIPAGEGIVSFSTLDEAVSAIDTVESNYRKHAHAAREIAEEYFNSDKILKRLLDDVYG